MSLPIIHPIQMIHSNKFQVRKSFIKHENLNNFKVSMKDTVNPKDIIQDVVHNFSSRYRGYAQYHNIQVVI